MATALIKHSNVVEATCIYCLEVGVGGVQQSNTHTHTLGIWKPTTYLCFMYM